MKIDNLTGKFSTLTSVSQPKTSKTGEADSINKTASSNVQLSGQVSDTSATFNADKVAEIKAAIAEGRFEVNANAVADGLISTVQDLLRSQSYSA
jgi:negative regulator of flagellin synthesis FlgM